MQSKDEQTVGLMPREHSRLSWYFLKYGGQIICEVTGRRKRSSTPGKGLEVPCLYTFKDKLALIKRLIKVLYSRSETLGTIPPEQLQAAQGFSRSHYTNKKVSPWNPLQHMI